MTQQTPEYISERVRFWEEQDRINQELIPKVIRQSELLTGHIADHENLPLVAANAIREAIAEVSEEQQRRYQSALEAAVADLDRAYDEALKQAIAEQERLFEARLEAATGALNEQFQTAISGGLQELAQGASKDPPTAGCDGLGVRLDSHPSHSSRPPGLAGERKHANAISPVAP